jgi:hypothetical protein
MFKSPCATSSEARIELQPPTPEALQAVKGIPRRTWMPRKRCWVIPLRLAPVAVEHFTDLGYRVVLDGQVHRPAGVNPFVDLANSIDPQGGRKCRG